MLETIPNVYVISDIELDADGGHAGETVRAIAERDARGGRTAAIAMRSSDVPPVRARGVALRRAGKDATAVVLERASGGRQPNLASVALGKFTPAARCSDASAADTAGCDTTSASAASWTEPQRATSRNARIDRAIT